MADKKFAILRVQKCMSKRAVTGAFMHNLRAIKTHNADPALLNQNSMPPYLDTVEKCKARYQQRLGDHKPRKGAVYGFEVVVTASPEQLAEMTLEQQGAYFKRAGQWLMKKFGKDNLCNLVLHRDEKTPHLQAVFIPMVDGKLSYKKMLGGHSSNMRKMQDDFYKQVGKPCGLDRGIKGSKASHKTIKEYYRETQALEQVRAQRHQEQSKVQRLRQEMEIVREGSQEALRTLFEPIHDMMGLLNGNVDEQAIQSARNLLDEYHLEKQQNPLSQHVPDEVKQEIDKVIEQIGWEPPKGP